MLHAGMVYVSTDVIRGSHCARLEASAQPVLRIIKKAMDTSDNREEEERAAPKKKGPKRKASAAPAAKGKKGRK